MNALMDKNKIIPALVCGGIHAYGADGYVYPTQLNNQTIVAATSAGADLVNNYVEHYVVSKILTNTQSMYIEPVSSALGYVALQYFIKRDNKPMMYQFLAQLGSSAIAHRIVPPM